MKKRSKRLALHRETLRNLNEQGLKKVAGGFTYDYAGCGTSCRCRDNVDTFSADCTIECPTTSLG